MFAQAEMPLALPFETAARAFDRAMADGGLVPQSRRAAEEGLEFVMPVGPRGGHFPARPVVVRLHPLHRDHQHLAVAVRWETTGPAGRIFPSLDADFELAAGEQPDTSKLSIIGRYQPPLAALGKTLDQVVMAQVASSTMTALLREIAHQLDKLST